MRIGMLVDVYKKHVSGVTHYVELNKRQLEKAGHEVYIFTFGEAASPDADERVIYSRGLQIPGTDYYLSLSYSPAARRLLQSMDVLHVQHPFVSGRLALRYGKPLGIPIVFTNHTRYDLYAREYARMVPAAVSEGLLRRYMPWFCRSVDLVISPSAGMAAVLRGMGVTSPIEVIPNGIELERFHGARALPRAQFGYRTDDVLLVYAGRVAFEKNLLFLLRAFAETARTCEEAQLLIMGGGTPTIQRAMQREVSELSLGERVRFTGMMPYDEVPPYLRMCDAFVTASVSEVHPLSVIEAMACGLPVVGIHSPGISDTVEDGKTGLLANEDSRDFAAKLTYLCKDATLRRTMGEQAEAASSRYGIERTAQTLLGQYERLVAARKPNTRVDLRTAEEGRRRP
ncbi:MAG: glycosyltransferase [Anaerolineae bacterium]